MLYGALEAGGTKMVLAVFNENGEMQERTSVPTTVPEETMAAMIAYFKRFELASLGISCFGPIDLNPKSETYGSFTTTPKLAWQDYPIKKTFEEALGIPVYIDTDVNGAALAEAAFGAAKDVDSCLYVTIGTGLGGGIIIHGKPVHGLMHPEIGHMLLTPDERDPLPDGICPYHKHCLEGLACGKAMQERWGVSGRDLPEDHVAWQIEVNYLSQMCHNMIVTLSPEKIILGGGVMHQKFLLPLIRQRTMELLNGYIVPINKAGSLDELIVEPGLGENSGIIGAYLLAKNEW